MIVLVYFFTEMSPYPYELVLKNNHACSVCYGGCGYAYNDVNDMLIIRHIDKRVIGKSSCGKLVFSDTFKPTYYHAVREHVCYRNKYFDGTVYLAKTLADSLGADVIQNLQSQRHLNILLSS